MTWSQWSLRIKTSDCSEWIIFWAFYQDFPLKIYFGKYPLHHLNLMPEWESKSVVRNLVLDLVCFLRFIFFKFSDLFFRKFKSLKDMVHLTLLWKSFLWNLNYILLLINRQRFFESKSDDYRYGFPYRRIGNFLTRQNILAWRAGTSRKLDPIKLGWSSISERELTTAKSCWEQHFSELIRMETNYSN